MERNILDRDVVGCVLDNSAIWGENGYIQIFWGEEDSKKLNEDGKKLLVEENRKKVLAEQRKTISLYWEQVNELLESLKDNNQEKIAEAYDKYSYALRRIYAHFITSTEAPSFEIEDRLKELVREKYPDRFDEVYISLTTPNEDDALAIEKKAWLEVIKNPDKYRILSHYRRYSVVLANIFSDEDVLKLGERRLNECTLEAVQKEIEESQKQKDATISKKSQFLNEINSKEVEQMSEFLCNIAILRLGLKHCWNGESFHLLPLFQKVAELADVSVRDIYMFYTRQEISDLLHGKPSIDKETLEKRKKYCLLHYHYPKIDVYDGEEALEAKKRILDASLPKQDVKSFKGSIANKGRVLGRARIVRFDNPHKVKEISNSLTKEDILVTGMTNPTMIPLINKVSGIITDEGGIACHAAIISREFNLPCIVGSSVATHILQDGEFIELDANTGIVKRLTEEEYLKLKSQ